MVATIRIAVACALLAVLPGTAAARTARSPEHPRAGATHRVVSARFLYVPGDASVLPTPPLIIAAGDSLEHTNLDAELHNLASFDVGPDGQPLFRSELIGAGETASVPVEDVPPGIYDFTCSIHPFMLGTLRVEEVGPPDPDPEVPGTPEVPEPAERGDVEIQTGDNFFAPGSITVPVGTTISWLNQGSINHTVTAADGSWDSSPLCPTTTACHQPGQRYRRTFTEPGVIPYYCKIHGTPGGAGHAGTITVVPPGEEQTAVGSVATSVSGSEVSVAGAVGFGGEAPVTISTDPEGDGPIHPAPARESGVDLTRATAYQPDPDIRSLFFEWHVAELPVAAPPEATRYTLPFRIGEAAFTLLAKRSNLAGATVPDDPDGHASHAGYSFQLLGSCGEGPAGRCSHLAWLTGSIDPDHSVIRVKVPLGVTPELVPGAVLGRGQGADPSRVRIRAGYETVVEAGTPTADEAEWGGHPGFTYRIPSPEALLGVAPAGTPESEVAFETPADVSGGSFSGSISAPGPGAWDVWARACFGANCDATVRRVEI